MTGSEMAKDEGVQAPIDEITTEVMDINTLTPEIIVKLLLKEFQRAKYSRDRKAILELLGKHLGMFREQHDHRHLHAHLSRPDLFKAIAETFGLEAVKIAAKDLGYTKNEINRLIENIKTPSNT